VTTRSAVAATATRPAIPPPDGDDRDVVGRLLGVLVRSIASAGPRDAVSALCMTGRANAIRSAASSPLPVTSATTMASGCPLRGSRNSSKKSPPMSRAAA